MKNVLLPVLMLSMVFLTSCLQAQEEAPGATVDVKLAQAVQDAPAETADLESAKVEDQPVEVGNKICPVSGEEVGQNGMEPQKVTYKGKVYNMCCEMCIKDFNKDPQKYAKIAEDEVAAADTVKNEGY